MSSKTKNGLSLLRTRRKRGILKHGLPDVWDQDIATIQIYIKIG
jgi:hypothetical protein